MSLYDPFGAPYLDVKAQRNHTYNCGHIPNPVKIPRSIYIYIYTP